MSFTRASPAPSRLLLLANYRRLTMKQLGLLASRCYLHFARHIRGIALVSSLFKAEVLADCVSFLLITSREGKLIILRQFSTFKAEFRIHKKS